MTLATRCTACGTSFRVVQDQLKVSGGWVRCGRCNEIFNAIEGLYEVGSPMAEAPPSGATVEPPPGHGSALVPTSRPEPPRATPPAAPPTPDRAPDAAAPAHAAASEAGPDVAPDVPLVPAAARVPERVQARGTEPAPEAESAAEPRPEPRPDTTSETPSEATPDSTVDAPPAAPPAAGAEAATGVPPRPAGDAEDGGGPRPSARASGRAPSEDESPPWQDQGGETVVPDFDTPSTPPGMESMLLEPSPADQWHADDSPPVAPMPSFLRKAERAERWRRPRVRLALALAALSLLVLLGAQAGIAYRDLIAARWPALRTPLAQACAPLGCTVEPPRHIAALSVESSSLLQLGSDTVYALQVAVRNRSELALLPPALELVLTDTQGRTVARRVLTLAEMGQPLPILPPGAEVSAQATLATGPQRVAGYTIEIFYP